MQPQSASSPASRNSAIELLRILSMVFILVVHFVGATFGLPAREELYAGFSFTTVGKALLEAMAICGVNCFVLISGYYGIKATWRGLLRYVLWCLFASLLVYAFDWVVEGSPRQSFWDALRVFTATDLWFVPAYLVLYLMSPLLNGGIASLDNRRMHLLLAALTFVNVYLGWGWGGALNPTGYTVMQMIYVYFIGRYLFRFKNALFRLPARLYFLSYLLLTLAIAATLNFAYNNPLVLLQSVALFLAFARLRPFHSRAVNYVGASAFMVYLMHKPPGPWAEIRGVLYYFDEQLTGISFVLACTGFLIAVFAVSIAIDAVRRRLFKFIRL